MPSNRFSSYFNFFLFGIDFLVLFFLFISFLFIHSPDKEISVYGAYSLIKLQYKSLILIIISWILISNQINFYKNFRFSRFIDILKKLVFQTFILAVILFAISGGKRENLYTTKESFYFILTLFCTLFIIRFILFFFLKQYRKKGYNYRNVAIIGQNKNTQLLIDLINEKKDLGMILTDFFVLKSPESNQTILDLDAFDETLKEKKIDYLYLSMSSKLSNELIFKITEIAQNNYVSIGFIPASIFDAKQNLDISYLDTFPVLIHKKHPLDNTLNKLIKRFFDIFFSLFIIIFILSWLVPIISLIIYVSEGKPIFFVQRRNGLSGEEFSCIKFRTMSQSTNNSIKPTEKNDPRITKIGRFLRKTSLDEIPQFINVLLGNMSVVGPRPHMIVENEYYENAIKKYSLRHYVKPGITGLAQIRGHRGITETHKDMEIRIQSDVYYVRNWSFFLDLYIIYKTILLISKGDKMAN